MDVSFIDIKGNAQKVDLSEGELLAAVKTGNPVAAINLKYAKDVNPAHGTPFQQMKLSMGLLRADKPNPFGLQSATIGAVFDGSAGINAAGNVTQQQTPFGTASRAFTTIAIIDEVMSEIQKERKTDAVVFNEMVANNVSINSEHFEQPVVDFTNADGPEKAKAGRVSQGALPPKIMFFKTSDRIRRIGAWTIGMEWTDQALKNTTIDYVARTTAHYLMVEQDERVYRYLSNLFTGDGGDFVTGAVAAVASNTLDAASTAGVLTHRAYIKFLARARKYRKITHLIMDIDTYLKVEGRTGRPGTVNYDPTLARIDPQARMINNTFGDDVRIFLVDSAADGGPVPANTIWALDASIAITKVTNTAAAYNAVEEYAMKRTTAMRMDWSEEVYRTLGDAELRPFDAMTITP